MDSSGRTPNRSPALAGMWAICPSADDITNLAGPVVRANQDAAQSLLQSEFSKGVTYSDLKWTDPLPVRGMAEGPTPRSSFQEFMPLDAVGNVPEHIQARLFNGEFTRVQCFLADSWRFDEIDRDSRKCAGHAYELRKHASLAEIVVKAVYDLEVTARSLHPALSDAATADFFRSWQVWRHVTEFCHEVCYSATGLKLANGFDRIHREAQQIVFLVCQQMSSYAHQIANLGVNASSELTEARQMGGGLHEDRADDAVVMGAVSSDPSVGEQSGPGPQKVTAPEAPPSKPRLNVGLISKWMEDEGYTNEDLAGYLKISVRAISSLRNDGDYHGNDAVTKLANRMNLDVEDLYLP